MRNIILHTGFLLFIATTVGLVSFIYSISSEDFSWVSRAGSIITIFGVLLTLKHHILSESRDIHSIVMEKRHYAKWAPKEEDEEYQKDIESSRIIMRDEYMGVALTVFGTVIWGYGDLLGKFF